MSNIFNLRNSLHSYKYFEKNIKNYFKNDYASDVQYCVVLDSYSVRLVE